MAPRAEKITMIACPSCHAPVQESDGFCEECGSELAASGPFCTNCGGAAITSAYCDDCGFRQPTPRDHVELEFGMDGAVVSDRGLRHSKNEDAMALSPVPGGMATVVCDGVSASPRPEEASAAAATAGLASLQAALSQGVDHRDATRTAALDAAEAVRVLAPTRHEAPACTYVSAVTGPETITVGWVGDSRAYWIGATGDELLTEDDSWAEHVVSHGMMTEAEAWADSRAHMLVGWLGADAQEIDVHVRVFAPETPGVLVVCSDGLWNYMASPIALAAALADPLADPVSGPLTGRGGPRTPLTVARELVRTALAGGGHDNITVAVIPFGGVE